MKTEELEKILFARNIKPSTMRLLVLQKLIEKPFAISHKAITDLFDKVDNTTVFRTL